MSLYVVLNHEGQYWNEKYKRYVPTLAKATHFGGARAFGFPDDYPPRWFEMLSVKRAHGREVAAARSGNSKRRRRHPKTGRHPKAR